MHSKLCSYSIKQPVLCSNSAMYLKSLSHDYSENNRLKYKFRVLHITNAIVGIILAYRMRC